MGTLVFYVERPLVLNIDACCIFKYLLNSPRSPLDLGESS